MLFNTPGGLFLREKNLYRVPNFNWPYLQHFRKFHPWKFLGNGSLKVVTYFISVSAYLDEMMKFSPVFIILLKTRFLWAAISLH